MTQVNTTPEALSADETHGRWGSLRPVKKNQPRSLPADFEGSKEPLSAELGVFKICRETMKSDTKSKLQN